MKRGFAVAVALAGALAFTAVAAGASKYYSGSDSDSQCGVVPHTTCDISFNGTVKNGTVKKVTNFIFNGIPISCNEGDFAFTNDGHPLPSMKVNSHRKFSGDFQTTNGAHYDVTGKFSKNYKTAKGTLQVQGDFPPQATGCDTGVDQYTVKRLVIST